MSILTDNYHVERCFIEKILFRINIIRNWNYAQSQKNQSHHNTSDHDSTGHSLMKFFHWSKNYIVQLKSINSKYYVWNWEEIFDDNHDDLWLEGNRELIYWNEDWLCWNLWVFDVECSTYLKKANTKYKYWGIYEFVQFIDIMWMDYWKH